MQARLCTEVTDQNCTVPLATSARMMCGSLNALHTQKKTGSFIQSSPWRDGFHVTLACPKKFTKPQRGHQIPPFPRPSIQKRHLPFTQSKVPAFYRKEFGKMARIQTSFARYTNSSWNAERLYLKKTRLSRRPGSVN